MLWPKWKRRSLIFKSGTLRTFRNCWRTQTHVWVKWRANTWPRPSPQWVFFSFLSICGNWPLTLHVAVLCWHAQWISECDAGLEEISLPPDSVQTSVPRGAVSRRSYGISLCVVQCLLYSTPPWPLQICLVFSLAFSLERISSFFLLCFILFNWRVDYFFESIWC